MVVTTTLVNSRNFKNTTFMIGIIANGNNAILFRLPSFGSGASRLEGFDSHARARQAWQVPSELAT